MLANRIVNTSAESVFIREILINSELPRPIVAFIKPL